MPKSSLADGQVAASATAILAATSPQFPGEVTVKFCNVGGSAETVALTVRRSGGTARRVARVVLAENEACVVRGVSLDPTDELLAAATNAAAVDYDVTAGGDEPFGVECYDANGALKSGSASIGSSSLTVSGDLTVNGSVTALGDVQNTATVTLTSAELLALHATPIEVIPAPGENKAIVIDAVDCRHAGGTAYAAVAAGDDILLKYTDGSGAQCFTTIETTGFLDQTDAQLRQYPANTIGEVVPVADAAVVASLGGAITTGDFDLVLRVRYRVVPTNYS